jgi:predicted adenine nucleotide alpha hydrolase (AANH) superfamily ATPase
MKILVHVCCAPCFTWVHESLKSAGHEVTGYFFNPNIHPFQEYQRRLHCLERYTALKPVEVIYDKEYYLDKFLIGALQAMYDKPPQEVIQFMQRSATSKGQKDKGGFSEKIRMREQLQIKLTPREGADMDEQETIVDVTPSEDEKSIQSEISLEKVDDPDFNPRCGYCIKIRLARAARYAKEHGFDAFTTTLLESKYQPHEFIRFVGDSLGKELGIKFLYQDFRTGWKESIKISKELDLYRQPYCGCVFSEYERYRKPSGR